MSCYSDYTRCCEKVYQEIEKESYCCKRVKPNPETQACPQEPQTQPLTQPPSPPKNVFDTLPEGTLFNDIGIPDDIGQPQFDTQTPSIDDISNSNTVDEDDEEFWFTEEAPPDTPLPNPPNETEAQIPPEPEPPNTETNPEASPLEPSNPPPSDVRQSTPQVSEKMMLSQTTTSNIVTSQDPDGILWLTPEKWESAKWDGTPYITEGKSKTEICAWLRPSNTYIVRGLREVFYKVKPFKDNKVPTVGEIDNWNVEVIRHFRNLLGNPTPIENDARLYIECRWSDERKFTTKWDSSYVVKPPPGKLGDSYGPCWTAGNAKIDTAVGHCGDSFFPNATDREPYISASPYLNNFMTYPELNEYTSRYAGTTGTAGFDAQLPWSIKLAYVISQYICTEGLIGHPGPYVGPDARQHFGCSWWVEEEGSNIGSYRGKWR